MKYKTILIDIDGTICSEEKTFERPLAKPFQGARKKINTYYKQGHTIILWTSRGWQEYKITKDWLDRNGFQYHQLLMGKPIADVFIDDRAVKFEGWDEDYI